MSVQVYLCSSNGMVFLIKAVSRLEYAPVRTLRAETHIIGFTRLCRSADIDIRCLTPRPSHARSRGGAQLGSTTLLNASS